MPTKLTGGCACGAIRYSVAAEPVFQALCQCRDCQRASGAGHAGMMVFPEAAIAMTGAPRFHDVKADSGATVSRGFCAACGSPVVNRTSGIPGVMAIAAGSLDEPNRFRPALVMFTKSGHAWDKPDGTLPAFQAFPPMSGD
jgi:hypothetical protein